MATTIVGIVVIVAMSLTMSGDNDDGGNCYGDDGSSSGDDSSNGHGLQWRQW